MGSLEERCICALFIGTPKWCIAKEAWGKAEHGQRHRRRRRTGENPKAHCGTFAQQ